MRLPLPFPDPAQDFIYTRIQDPVRQMQVIQETTAKRMGLIWSHVVHCVYSEIPGFSKENRSSGVYWFQYRNLPTTYLFAEIAPTKKFYPLIGMTIPKPGEFRREKGLSLRAGLCPPIPGLPEPARLGITLFIERALPVKCLLAAWSRSRRDLIHLIGTADCKVRFEGLADEDQAPDALDRYHLPESRKHRVDLLCELEQITEVGSITTPVLALAKIYHVIQGVVRGDPTRLRILAPS